MRRRMMGRLLVAMFVSLGATFGGLGSGWAAGTDLPYLWDQLKKPAYKAAFAAMFRGAGDAQAWTNRYSKTMVGNPGSLSTTGGRTYEVYTGCQPHFCSDNSFAVVFTRGGGQAWSLFTAQGKQRFFGSPNGTVRKLLFSNR